MKKIFLLLVTAAAVTFTSCNNDDDRVITDNDTVGETFEVGNVNFFPDQDGRYGVRIPLDPVIFDSDVVLVYRQTDVQNGNPVWRSVPQTLYFPNGEIEYITEFSVNEILINIDYSPTLNLDDFQFFTQNQRFRIVIVPSDFSSSVNTNDYNAVMKALDKSENDVQMLEVNKIY